MQKDWTLAGNGCEQIPVFGQTFSQPMLPARIALGPGPKHG